MSFDIDLRVVILLNFVQKLRSLGHQIIAAASGERHLHALTELPWDVEQIEKLMAKCKQRSSHAVRDRLPGTIWSAGGEYKWIKDKKHLHNAYNYIRTKQEPGTVVWSHRPEENWIDFEIPVIVMKRK